MSSDKRVSSHDYKIIPLRKAILSYFIVFGFAAAFYFIASEIFEGSNNFQIIVYGLLWSLKLAVGIWACTFGYRVIKSKQSPPPDSWVIENWKVYKGQKAHRLGWFMLFTGLFIGVLAIYSGYLLIRISLLLG